MNICLCPSQPFGRSMACRFLFCLHALWVLSLIFMSRRTIRLIGSVCYHVFVYISRRTFYGIPIYLHHTPAASQMTNISVSQTNSMMPGNIIYVFGIVEWVSIYFSMNFTIVHPNVCWYASYKNMQCFTRRVLNSECLDRFITNFARLLEMSSEGLHIFILYRFNVMGRLS